MSDAGKGCFLAEYGTTPSFRNRDKGTENSAAICATSTLNGFFHSQLERRVQLSFFHRYGTLQTRGTDNTWATEFRGKYYNSERVSISRHVSDADLSEPCWQTKQIFRNMVA